MTIALLHPGTLSPVTGNMVKPSQETTSEFRTTFPSLLRCFIQLYSVDVSVAVGVVCVVTNGEKATSLVFLSSFYAAVTFYAVYHFTRSDI